MYNLTNKLNELDLLIESTKEEFNDYAESLLSEYAFDEVKPLLESAHFEAELIITEAENAQISKIQETSEKTKKKVEDKFNSPAYTKKCKEIEEAIKADPSVGEQLIEVPAVDKICKQVTSLIKSGKNFDKEMEDINNAIMEQTETITLKQLMLKRKRIQTIIGATIGVVATAGVVLAGKVINDTIRTKTKRKQQSDSAIVGKREPTKFSYEPDLEGQTDFIVDYKKWEKKVKASNDRNAKRGEAMVYQTNVVRGAAFLISTMTILATSVYSVIMGVKISKMKSDIRSDNRKLSELKASLTKESYFDSLFNY